LRWAMRSWAEMSGEALTWTQLRAGLYCLRGGEGVYAQLRCQAAASSSATGQTGDERWSFRRIGLQRPRIAVRRAGQERDVAVFRHSGQGEGTLVLGDGRRFAWRRTRMRGREKGFFDADGEPVIRFTPLAMPGTVRARVDVPSDRLEMAELPLLALVGWYRMLIEMEQQGDEAVGALARRRTGRATKRLPGSR
jgi:hypothetical protein